MIKKEIDWIPTLESILESNKEILETNKQEMETVPEGSFRHQDLILDNIRVKEWNKSISLTLDIMKAYEIVFEQEQRKSSDKEQILN